MGVYLFGQAYPIAIVTLVMYYSRFRLWFSDISATNYQTIRDDINYNLALFHDRFYDTS